MTRSLDFLTGEEKYSSEGSEQGYNTARSIISVKEPCTLWW